MPQQKQKDRPAACGPRVSCSDAEILDFSSASEDEDPCGSRSRTIYTNTVEGSGPSSGPAANMNLSALLMKHMTNAKQMSSESSEDSTSDTDTKSVNIKETKAGRGKTDWLISSDSEEERNKVKKASDHIFMEESEDIEILYNSTEAEQLRAIASTKKDQRLDLAMLAVQRQRCPEEVKSFDSSEDEAPVRKIKHKKSVRRNSAQKSVQFTGLKCPTMHSRKPQITGSTCAGTLDTLLGTVQFLESICTFLLT